MKKDQAETQAAVAQAHQWADGLDEIASLIGGRFPRAEPRARAVTYLRGLVSPVERKNGWQLAEEAGDATPYATQHLLGRAVWSADEVRDDLRAYVIDHLGDPDGVLVVDETGFLKKGAKSAGVQRQYSGTAGRIENSQIGVFLAYATRHGRTFLDRELYLPRAWADDPERRLEAEIPPGTKFATKLVLARRMIERAQEAGVPFRWVTGDEVYGNDSHLRSWLEARQICSVLAVAAQRRIWYRGARRRAAEIAALLPRKAWRRLQCRIWGEGGAALGLGSVAVGRSR